MLIISDRKLIVMKIYFALLTMLFCISCSQDQATVVIDAEVLTIQDKIFSGSFDIWGGFLSSSSGGGSFANDKIKIGVRFDFYGELYLLDLEVLHAELAHFCGQNSTNKLPIRICVWYNNDLMLNHTGLKLYLGNSNRVVYNECYIGQKRTDMLIEKMRSAP